MLPIDPVTALAGIQSAVKLIKQASKTVDDVASLSAKLISINAQGVFNVGTGEAISPIEVAHMVGCDFEVVEDASSCQERPKAKFVAADNEKITHALGKIEWTSLNSGISNIMTTAEFSKP